MYLLKNYRLGRAERGLLFVAVQQRCRPLSSAQFRCREDGVSAVQLWAGCRFCEPIPLGQPVQACDESIHVCSRELELAPSGSRPLALYTLCLQLVLSTGHQANPARFLATEWMAGVDSGQGHESLARSKRTVAKCACFTIDVSVRPSGCNNSKTAQRMLMKFGTGGGLLKCERIPTLWYVSPWGLVSTRIGWLYQSTIPHTATRPDTLARARWAKWLNIYCGEDSLKMKWQGQIRHTSAVRFEIKPYRKECIH